jgi:hypothetical protein
MTCEKSVGWAYVTNDACLFDGKGKLWGVVIFASQKGGYAHVYAGRDKESGRLIGPFSGHDEVGVPYMFPKPLRLDDGLFVELVNNIYGALVLYE